MKYLCIALAVMPVFCQIVTIPTNTPGNQLISRINNNIDWLNTNKAASTHTHSTYAALSHVHLISDVTGLQAALDAKSATTHNHDATYAALVHVHLISGVTGLQAAHDAKSATTHNHDTVYATLAHVHLIADVTGLQAALDAKSATSHNHDATYAPIAKGVTNGDAHDHSGGDGAQIAYSTLAGLPTLGDAAAKNTGTSAGTVAAGNHTHAGVYEPANANIQTHISSTANPHGVTKAQVGLGSVDNTADAAKSVATAANATAVGGITITGTPATGQIPVATGTAAATWQTPVSGTHTQNTDTGTTAASFQINSGGGGCRWKDISGVMTARNAADTADCDVRFLTGESTSTSPGTITEAAIPGTAPAAGTVSYGADSSVSGPWWKINAGNQQFRAVQPVAATSNQWITNIGSDGVQTKSQPSAANLSNGTTGSGAVVLATSPALITPNLGTPSAINLTNATGFPTLNQNTSGTAANLSGTPALPNGTTATTQSAADNSTKLATTAYSDAAAAARTGTVATGTAALGTSAIASTACASVVTVTATGVATTDVIAFTPNADVSAVTGYAPATTGGLAIYPYPTASNVNFKVCNPTSSSITPGAITLNWRVVR